MSPYHDDSELDISNYEYDGIYKRQDEAMLKGMQNKQTVQVLRHFNKSLLTRSYLA